MPKSECESLLLALSWQVVHDSGLRNNVAGGSRQSHSIGGTLNGSQRVPRIFSHRAPSAIDVRDTLPLPHFVLSAWGIPVPDPSSDQQLVQLQQPQQQQEHQQKQIEQKTSGVPRETLGSIASHPTASAIKEAESFFGNGYRPLAPKPAASPTSLASAADHPLSAGNKRAALVSDQSPPRKERHEDFVEQPLSTPIQPAELPIPLQQQQQQHDRRHWPWARQLDPSYLQRSVHEFRFQLCRGDLVADGVCSLREMQGSGGGSPRLACFKVSPQPQRSCIFLSFQVRRQALNAHWQPRFHPRLLLLWPLPRSPVEARFKYFNVLRYV